MKVAPACRNRVLAPVTAVFLLASSAAHAGQEDGPTRAAADRSIAAAVQPVPASDAQAASPKVTLVLTDPSPVIGLAGETLLRIEVENPPATPMPMPRMLCSVGQIEDLGREGPARFTARYVLPPGRFPQPAILVAEFPDLRGPLRGMAAVALRAAATPSFRTDPGAQVTLRVGDRDFGPQVAPADGVVHVPVVVPPGVNFAIARSVNRNGKSTEGMVDLHVPYSQRLLFAAPETLAAGTVGEVAVYAVEPSGRPIGAPVVELRAGRNRVQPLGSRAPGEARFLVSAPTILRRRSMRIEAQLKDQGTTRIATRIGLVPGLTAGLELEPEAPRLEREPGSSLRVYLGAEDAYGNPVDAGRAGVLVDGQPAVVQTGADGEPMVVVRTPEPKAARKEVVVEGVLENGHAFARLPIGPRPRPVGRKLPDIIAYPRRSLTPRLGVLTNFGPLVGVTFFLDGFVYPSLRHPGLGLGLALGFVESSFAAESTGAISDTALSTVPLSFQVRQHWVHGRAFGAVGAGAGFAIAIARVRSYGATPVGSSVGGLAEASVEAGLLLHRAHLVLAVRYVGLYLPDFTSGDKVVGNAGGAMMDVGYRRVW